MCYYALNDLAESCCFSKLTKEFFQYVPTSVIQRLGYLLDDVLDCRLQADDLYLCIKKHNVSFRKIALKNSKHITNYGENKKWKVIINEHIEIDE